jgi:putative inorganic carbon (HCO3(-)) transporter
VLKTLKPYWIYIFSFVFIILNSYLVVKEFYYLALIPCGLALVFMAFFRLDNLMWFIVFCTPLSINLEELDIGGIGMYIPTEPLMFGVMLLFFFKLLLEKKFDSNIIKHPITLAILVNLVWLTITSVTSEMPVVSFKFLLARVWFIVCFYFIATQLFREKKNYKKFIWAYVISLTGVIFYAIIHLSMYNFDQKPAHWVMNPFYKDHTSYGAVLAMYLPILFLFFNKRNTPTIRIVSIFLIGIFTVAIILSYTRAAWVSLAGALVLYLIYKYKVKFKTLLAIGVGCLIALALSWNTLVINMERNSQESSDKLSEHVESISNVSSDASNLERLNRWSSAWRMFQERPFFGWGPGTYMFQYAPFQMSDEQTIISTNSGNMGNAHSEYIGPLAESGVFGMLTFLIVVITVFYRGSLLYHRLPKGEFKTLVLLSLLSLFTYVTHGLLNNYLDTDKVSVPFWGFIAIIVAIDVYHSKESLDSEAH